MKNHKNRIILLIILVVSLLLRTINFEGRASFGWDQERDLKSVESIIYDHHPTLIGPVARGEGGFMLGPLYYYLLAPTTFLLRGSPIALPTTSVIIDLITVFAFYAIIKRIISEKAGLIAASIWGFSWLTISSSLTSWNVILVPLWTLLTLYSVHLLSVATSKSQNALYLLALLFGLAFHVHALLIPIIPLFIIANWRELTNYKHVVILKSAAIFLLTISPLILFDLRHNFLNYNLFRDFIMNSTNSPESNHLSVILSIWTKLINLYSRLLSGSTLPIIGVSAFLAFFLSGKKSSLHGVRTSHLILFLYFLIVLSILKDPDFPEYYLLPLTIPVVITFAWIVSDISNRYRIILPISALLFTIFQLSSYNFSDSPFGLRAQGRVADRIKDFSEVVDLRIHGQPSIDAGLRTVIKKRGITIQEDSAHKIVLTESTGEPGTVSGAEHVFEENILGYKLSGFIVK